MHTLLERRDRSLMLSLDNEFFRISKKGRDVIFDEKVMLQNT